MPTGGATVRRLTLSENRSCYEAEAPRFSVWVLSLERGPFKIDVTYEDSENAKYDRNFSLDFKQWENLSKVPSNLSKAVDALEGIEKNLKKSLRGKN